MFVLVTKMPAVQFQSRNYHDFLCNSSLFHNNDFIIGALSFYCFKMITSVTSLDILDNSNVNLIHSAYVSH